jgi:hypothetical protein
MEPIRLDYFINYVEQDLDMAIIILVSKGLLKNEH